MEYENVITAHEAGHCLALAAAGLTGEFVSASVAEEMYNGKPVHGLTLRNGDSLMAYSGELTQQSVRQAAHLQDGTRGFYEFLVAQAPRVCLPHICFFLGGGACDRWLKREDPARNAIDLYNIRQLVFPAMTLVDVGDEAMAVVQTKVDAFLAQVFEREGKLFGDLYKALGEKGILRREELGPLFNEMKACGERARADFDALQDWFTTWYEPRVAKFKG